MPKISFIMPAYKRRFLKEAIASVLAQSYRDFELIVVDDASPENLKEIVDTFSDTRMSYRRNAENLGGRDLVAAWNRALSQATGEWVVCAGDDDVYAPDYAAEMMALAERYPAVDAMRCRLAYINATGEVERLGNPRPAFEKGIEVVYHSCVARVDQTLPEFMYRREALLARGGYLPSPRGWYSDVMTCIALAYDRGLASSDRFLVRWRASGENISSRFDDANDKIEATVQFHDWIWKVIGEVRPATSDEALLLRETRRQVDAVMLRILGGSLSGLSIRAAFHAIAASRLDTMAKNKMRRMRLWRAACDMTRFLHA